MSHTWMSHVTPVDESWHTSGGVMSHTWMIHVTHVNELRSRVTYVNESCEI